MVLSDKEGFGWKVFLTCWAFMECLLFGGLHYGWGSFSFILKSEGVYADLCLEESPVNATSTNMTTDSIVETNTKSKECKAQDKHMALCFTIASTLYTFGSVVLGQVNYKWGTRVTRIVAFLIFTAGSLMTAFISKENPWLMFPAMSCLAVGGLPLVVTDIQIANLFEKGNSTVVNLLCGAFDGSSAMMLLTKIASENGFSKQNMFLLITGLHCLVLVNTFFFLPKHFITNRKPKDIARDVVEHVEQVKEDKEPDKKVETELPTLRSCVCDMRFLMHILWLCVLQLRFYYFIGTMNPYLERLLDRDLDKVSYYTNVCYYTMTAGIVTSIVSGTLYDWQKQMLKDGKSERYRKVAPAAVPLAAASVLSVIMSILVLIPNPNLLYITFIVMTFKRSFLYGLGVAFIAEIFPAEYFGILFGIFLSTGGIFSFFQYALFLWAEAYDGGVMQVDTFLLVLVCVSFLHPLYIWISSWREERKFKGN